MKEIQVWAHRGASGYLPENTLEAFQLAAAQGADGIELDVQKTKDGHLVIMHDETVDRTTNGKGWVKDFTLEELRELKIMDGDGNVYRVPTLREVLEFSEEAGLFVNIELKNSIWLYERLEEDVMALVKELEMKNQIIYSSFNHYSVKKIKELDSSAEVGALFCDGIIHLPEYVCQLGADAIHPALYHCQYPNFVEVCRSSGLKVHVWTVNREEDIEIMKQLEVDAVITNYPDRALKILKNR